MDDHVFTVILDWLAFTVPQATVDEIREVLGGEWFEASTGFRGYPTCWMTNPGRHGVGKLGTGAPRNPKEVHVDLSAGIVVEELMHVHPLYCAYPMWCWSPPK